ncbi:MAG: phospho-N-acetylmuramoyl-pentapeptide-transferase [Puniceicoccales bacterium]|nr:phospho-N-acetylmuramoyl-pentapeptide-transferase [Puniceicoccales bacterium]
MVRALAAFFLAFSGGILLFPLAIAVLKKMKVRQSFRTKEEVRDLADLHAAKANTPTMGGLCLWLLVVVASLVCGKTNGPLLSALYVFTAFCAIGLADDVAKMRSGKSAGISPPVKLFFEALALAALFLALRIWDFDLYESVHAIYFPPADGALVSHLPTILLLPFSFFVVAGSANGVNLADGADGLAAWCSMPTTIALAIACAVSATDANGFGELAVAMGALCGSLLAFLWHNCQPASIFMGDCGSLAIGGLFGVTALLICQPFLMAIAGGVFVAEALSVFAQVYYFKWSGGKRIFRMAPIHHHFELSGWAESRVVGRFCIVSIICASCGIALNLA